MRERKFEVGDRVRHMTINQFADVKEVDIQDGEQIVLLHWGTEYGREFTSWHKSKEVDLVYRKK